MQMFYCTHPLPRVYNEYTGEPEYGLGQVYVCPKCSIQWMVVQSDIVPELNMWQQPAAKTIRDNGK